MSNIKKKNNNKNIIKKGNLKSVSKNTNTKKKTMTVIEEIPRKNTSKNNQLKNKTVASKKSNYTKIQGKVLEEKKKKKEQVNNKKQIKQNKQVARNIKKEKLAKERTLKRRIGLVLLSFAIKIKNLFIKIFNLLKILLINIVKIIKKIPLFFKKIFQFTKNKLFSKKNIKNMKTKKTKKVKKENKRKSINEDVLSTKKIIWQKNKLSQNKNTKKPLRSLTGRVLPSTFLKGDRKIRKTYYLKESLIFMIIFTLIDFIGFYRIKKLDMFHIFDNSVWNIVLTTTLTMLIIFIGSYIIDYIITESTLRIRKRKR